MLQFCGNQFRYDWLVMSKMNMYADTLKQFHPHVIFMEKTCFGEIHVHIAVFKSSPAVTSRTYSWIFRKGKVKPLEIVEKDKIGRFVEIFISTGEVDGGVDMDVALEFVCCMYAQGKIRDVNEARYSKLMQMTGTVDQVC